MVSSKIYTTTVMLFVLLFLFSIIINNIVITRSSNQEGTLQQQTQTQTQTQTHYEIVSNTVVAGPHVGRYTNVKINNDGQPIIVANDETDGGAWLTVCYSNENCLKNNSYVLDSSSDSNNARYMTMQIHPTLGTPILVYANHIHGIRVLLCLTFNCTSYTTNTIDYDPSLHPSIAFRSTGQPTIAYYTESSDGGEEGLRIAYCLTNDCSNIIMNQPLTGTGKGKYPSIILDDNDIPYVAYYYDNEKQQQHVGSYLEMLQCGDMYCSTTIGTNIIDKRPNANIGQYLYMKRGILDGNPIIMYADVSRGLQMIAHCQDMACSTTNNNNSSSSSSSNSSNSSNTTTTITKTVIGSIGTDPYGEFPELDMSPWSGYPIMSFINQTGNNPSNKTGISTLCITECLNIKCTKFNVQSLVSGTSGYGRDSSIAFALKAAPKTTTTNNFQSQQQKEWLIYISFLDYNFGDNKYTRLLILKKNSTTLSSQLYSHSSLE